MTTASAELASTLLGIARRSVEEAAGRPVTEEPIEPSPELAEPRATFVTLKLEGVLRGCIGSLAPHRPLAEDVRDNARAAALHDSRFSPVRAEELDRISIEISVLSPLEELEFESEAGLLDALRPEEDGIVIACEGRRATFLPQVWETLPLPRVFLGALKSKAGLPRDYWSDEMRVWRFTVEKIRE